MPGVNAHGNPVHHGNPHDVTALSNRDLVVRFNLLEKKLLAGSAFATDPAELAEIDDIKQEMAFRGIR